MIAHLNLSLNLNSRLSRAEPFSVLPILKASSLRELLIKCLACEGELFGVGELASALVCGSWLPAHTGCSRRIILWPRESCGELPHSPKSLNLDNQFLRQGPSVRRKVCSNTCTGLGDRPSGRCFCSGEVWIKANRRRERNRRFRRLRFQEHRSRGRRCAQCLWQRAFGWCRVPPWQDPWRPSHRANG